MRKYRIWDVDNNEYLKEERKFHFYLNADGTLMISTGWNDEKIPCDYKIADPKKYIIEWTPGLKDKNGKEEIYEGDIIQAHKKYENVKYKVIWYSCAFFIENINTGEIILLHDRNIVSKIIGNIHENPEHLK